MLADKVFVGLENTPHAFDLCGRVMGQGGANLDFIRSETGAMVILKGGSGDKTNPLHLALNHSRGDRLAAARQLALSLVESVRQEFQQWSTQNTPATPQVPALNVPPPIMVKPPPPVQTAPPPASNALVPPPTLQAPLPLNITPMQHQVLQLVPQQQIFVAPDGSHYVKVTFAQTPMTNTGPLMTMSLPQGQVNVIPQPIQVPPVNVMPQLSQAPVVNAPSFGQLPMQTPVQVMGPSVCSAPTLSTQSVTQQQQWTTLQQQQPIPAGSTALWPAPPQHAAMPAPPVNTSAPPPVNLSQPWAAPVPAAQQNIGTSVCGNLPWYKNLQNTASSQQDNKSNENRQIKSRMIADERSESSDINNSGSGKKPVWETGPGHGMPDLLEEIQKDNENERSGGSRSRSGRDSRRDRRDRRRRPYTDADTYRRQFRSGGVLGEDRHGDRKDENAPVQESEESKDEQCSFDNTQACNNDPANTSNNAGPGSVQRSDRYPSGQIARTGQINVGGSSSTSKWDRPAAHMPQPQGNQYNQSSSNHYQQQQLQPIYQNQSAYQQSSPYGQPPQENKSASYQQTQNTAENQAGSRHEKQTPTTQYVGAPTQYTATASNWMANQNQYYQNEKPTWSQSQHPWNRSGQGEPPYGGHDDAARYGERPWGNTNTATMVPPPRPPYATEEVSNNWSANY